MGDQRRRELRPRRRSLGFCLRATPAAAGTNLHTAESRPMGVEREEIEKARTTTQTTTTLKTTEARQGRCCAICIIADEASTQECSHTHLGSLAGYMWAAKGRLESQARWRIITGLKSTSTPGTKDRSSETKEDRCAICIMVGWDDRSKCGHAQDPFDHMRRVRDRMTGRMRLQVIRGLTRRGTHPNNLRSNERNEGGGEYCDDENARILEEHRRECEAILEERRKEARRLVAIIETAAGHAPSNPWSDRQAKQELRAGGAEGRH